MTSTLIVPIDVAALAVGNPDVTANAENLAPRADFSLLPAGRHAGPYLSSVALENSEPFEGQVPLLAGIHVHWALPDGITAGTSTPDGVVFPSAPNRWVVTRIVVSAPPGKPATTALRSWVVESDRLSPAATAPPGLQQPTVPIAIGSGAPGQTFAYLGQAFDLATWTEVGATVPRLTPFTAVGYGDPAFAGFYPSSSTVFGHYDALLDLTGFEPSVSTIAYHVAGWYSDAAADPLTQPHATPATYKWTHPGDDVPVATVCAGIVDAIGWDPAKTYLGDGPGALTAAVASSTQEAVSALMASVVGNADAEQVLNALQFGLLSGSTNEVDSLAEFEEDVHGAGFATLSAGPLWTVTAATSGGDPSQGSEVALPDQQAEALNALNALQLQANDASFELAERQFRLFADWYKYQLVQHAPDLVPTSLQNQAGAVQQYLLARAGDITTLQSSLATLGKQVQDACTALCAVLDKSLSLTNCAGAPRYYQPTDPVLVLSGPDVQPTERYGNDGARSADGTLACRLDSQLVTGATLAAGLVPGSAAAALAASALGALAAAPAGAPAALLQALAGEAFLVAPGLAVAAAAAVAAQGGAQNPAVVDLPGTTAALTASATALLAGTAPQGVTYAGTAPAELYRTGWNGSPWLPLLLQYEVSLDPVQYLTPSSGPAAYPPSLVTDNFTLDADEIDLAYSGAAPATSQGYAGSTILTPRATVDLASQISTFLQNTAADPELSAVLTRLTGLPILSQGLTGFTDALIMRGLTLQMPVGDPFLPPPVQTEFVAPVAAAVDGQNVSAPLPEYSFNPIRTGAFSISKLRLVDVFGRFRDYPSPSVVVAKGLAPPSGLGLGAGQAFLPPRITQPARLLLRWRAAHDRDVETNPSPATSPVLGWVIPDYLDNSILVYNAAGTALGELALSADRKRVLWTPAPGGPYPIQTVLPTVMKGQNADLAAFAEGVFNDGDASFFAPFFDAVREALTFSLPAQFRETASQAVLLGQPLALARASLTLDVAGPPATDESWPTFAAAVLDGTAPTDAGLGEVDFPVMLGGLDHLDDTLVGYWIGPAAAADFRTFYAPYATTSEGGVEPPTHETLMLKPSSASAGQTDVVVLMDPRGSVHATTGILPVKAIDIPPAHYTKALGSLAVTFDCTPVLSGSNVTPADGSPAPMTMVAPKVAAGSWSWVTTDGSTWKSTTLVDAATSQATLNYTPQRISEGWLGLGDLPAGT